MRREGIVSRASFLDAATRALCGEFDRESVRAVSGDRSLARVLALMRRTHPGVRTIATLHGQLPSLLDERTVVDAAVRDAVQSLIGRPEGKDALSVWAQVAPAGWGATCADALIDAVQKGMCRPAAAAALIGPCDRSAGLLTTPLDIACAIRRWGQSVPGDPTAWTTDIVHATRKRLCADVGRDSKHLAVCLPWLPPGFIPKTVRSPFPIGDALDAFINASQVAHARHAHLVRQIVAQAEPVHLGNLTRLACVTGAADIWRRVKDLVWKAPHEAERIVLEVPWDDVPEDVQAVIMKCADRFAPCAAIAAIAAARRRDRRMDMRIPWNVAVFFASLDPAVWDALDAATQRQRLDALPSHAVHLAIRSLGLRPDILMRTPLSDAVVHAVQRHTRDDATLRETLFPVALRGLALDATCALLAACPDMPPDPGAFFCIVNGPGDVDHGDASDAARAVLHTPADLAVAITLRRCTEEGGTRRLHMTCAALNDALRGWTWARMDSILALLGDKVRAFAIPDLDEIAHALAHPDHRQPMRQTLSEIAALDPDIAVPSLLALRQCMTGDDDDRMAAAESLPLILRTEGDRFVSIAAALADDALRHGMLPLPDDAALIDALLALVRDDPDVGRRLALALDARAWNDALRIVLTLPPHHAIAIWHAIPESARNAFGEPMDNAGMQEAYDPVAALAIAALRADDPDLRACGVAALANRPALIRTLLPRLPQDIQHALHAHPAIAAALADLDEIPPSTRSTRGAPCAIRRRA